MGEALTIWGNSRMGAAENWGQFYQCVSATPSVELGTRVRIKVQLVKKEQACFLAQGGGVFLVGAQWRVFAVSFAPALRVALCEAGVL